MNGEEVVALRRRFKLSQEAFARVLGVAMRTVCRWEKSGKGVIRPHKALGLRLAKLAQGGEVSAEYRTHTPTEPATLPPVVLKIEFGEKTLDVLRSLVFALEKR
jgi:transcriptional regulator with XRE-family HTH domain